MPEYDDNPAGRLRLLLLQLHRANQNNTNVSAWEAWVALLAPTASAFSPEALAAMTRLLELPGAIRVAVGALREDEDEEQHLLEHLDKVELFLGASSARTNALTQAYAVFASGPDISNSAAVQSLGTCSRHLHRRSPELGIPRDEIDRLIQAVATLMGEVRASSLDGATQVLLLRHLHKLLESLELVRITGVAPVEESLDAFAAALARHPQASEDVSRSGFGERLGTIANTLRGLFNIARGINEVAAESHTMLDHGAHAITDIANLLN
jgi:hypothetical protein